MLQGTYSFVPGKVGQGYKPGVEGSVVVAPNSSALPVFAFSIGAWIRVDGIDSVPLMQVLWKGDNLGTSSTTPYSVSVQGTGTYTSSSSLLTTVGTPGAGKVVVITGNGDTETDLFSNTTLSTGTFYYVVVTADGNNLTLYINGAIDTQTAEPPMASSNSPIQIGGIQALNSDTFDGVIDELQIWGAPISQFQVSTIYKAGAAGECQDIWFTETATSKIGFITPDGATSNDFTTTTASSFPYNITGGPDGNIWFTENTPNNIGEFLSVGGGGGIGETAITYPAADGPSSAFGAWGITSGPDGNLWFTESHSPEDSSFVGNITTGGTITTFPIGFTRNPEGITAAPDGNMWFTEPTTNTIGNIAPTSTSTVNHYTIPTASSGAVSITLGSDGNLWFTESAVNQIGVITTGGTVTHEYPIPAGVNAVGIAAAGTGYHVGDVVTVVQSGASGGTFQVSTINATGGVTTLSLESIGTGYTLSTAPTNITGGSGTGLQVNASSTSNSFGPAAITLGPDGNVWFVAASGVANNIIEVSPSGQFTAYPVPIGGSAEFITEGPDGNIWYTDNFNSAIAQLVQSTGVTTEFQTPTASSGPWGIGTGPAVMPVPAAPTNVSGILNVGGVPQISWTASAGVVGYNVYRSSANSSTGPFTLVNSNPITSTTFPDLNVPIPPCGVSYTFYYFVTTVGTGNTESPDSNESNGIVVNNGGPC